jgi:hypothetical protein
MTTYVVPVDEVTTGDRMMSVWEHHPEPVEVRARVLLRTADGRYIDRLVTDAGVADYEPLGRVVLVRS